MLTVNVGIYFLETHTLALGTILNLMSVGALANFYRIGKVHGKEVFSDKINIVF